MESNRTLAMVAGTPVTEAELEEAVMQMRSRGRNYDSQQGRAALLDQLIAQKLFLADAKKTMLEYDPVFKAQLNRVKEDLLFQFAVSRALEKVKVTDEEIKKYYDEHPDDFVADTTVEASHILVDSKEKADDIRSKILSGEIGFEEAAGEYSSCPSAAKGGSLGEFGHGQMVPEFDEACFSMEPGQISEPVKTQFGYHIIRLDARNEGKKIGFEEAKDGIREALMTEKSQKAYQTRLNQLKLMYPVDR